MPDTTILLTPVLLLVIVLLFWFLGCTFSAGVSSGTAYADAILEHAALVAYWRLGDAADATQARDAKETHDGTYRTVVLAASGQSPATADPPVLVNGADNLISESSARSVRVDGGYVVVPFSPALNTGAFTIEAWVHPEWAAAESGVFRAVVMSRDRTAGEGRHGFTLFAGPDEANPGDSATYWQVWLGDGTAWRVLRGPVVRLAQTTFLAVTFNGSTLSLYENGFWQFDLTAACSVNTARPLHIGMGGTERPPEAPLYPFKGRIQEVALYSLALDSLTVATHYSNGT